MRQAHKDANAQLISVYWPRLGDDLGELIAENLQPYVALLIGNYMTDLLCENKIRVVGIRPSDIEAGESCESGILRAIELSSSCVEDFERRKQRYQAYLDEYMERTRSNAVLSDKYCVACQQFCDMITPIDSPNRRNVFDVAKEIRDYTARSSFWAAGWYQVTGT